LQQAEKRRELRQPLEHGQERSLSGAQRLGVAGQAEGTHHVVEIGNL
jgi:hypothetical protein